MKYVRISIAETVWHLRKALWATLWANSKVIKNINFQANYLKNTVISIRRSKRIDITTIFKAAKICQKQLKIVVITESKGGIICRHIFFIKSEDRSRRKNMKIIFFKLIFILI